MKPVHPRRRVNVELLNRLRDILGGKRVSHRPIDTLNYGRDLWTRGMLAVRRGEIDHRPEFIVWPQTTEEVSRVLRLCNEMEVPVTPFGGGSGLTGGAIPLEGGVILDTKKMKRLVRISEQSSLAVCQPGILGVQLERELNRLGYTLGHFPTSLNTSTLGGYLATRSAGLAATYYGKIEDLVISMQVVLADGTVINTRTAPRRATGPDFNHLFLGSEGLLGVITRAHLRIRLLPEAFFMRSLSFKNLDDALTSLRLIMRAGLRPMFVRLSDEADTDETLRAMGIDAGGNLLLLVFGGWERQVETAGRKAVEICREHNSRDFGEEPAKLWYEKRFSDSFRQSELFQQADTVFTMVEVAALWSRVRAVYEAVHAAVPKGLRLLVCLPHAYPEGASLQFSVVGRAPAPADLELHEKAWEAILNVVHEAGGVISHHTGLGLRKMPWLARHETTAYRLLVGVKRRLDPQNILNPGKVMTSAENDDAETIPEGN